MGGRGARSTVRIKEKFSKLTGYIPEVSRETEKAYLLDYKIFDDSQENWRYNRRTDSIQYGLSLIHI